MEKRDKIRFYYSVFLGVYTAVIGVLFLAEAADLYYSGVDALQATQGMYSRAEVGARLGELLAPLILWVLAIVLGAVIFELFPAAQKRDRVRDDVKLYSRLRRRASEEKNPDIYAKIKQYERVRLGVRLFALAFCLLSAAMCIAYLATASHFTSLAELNQNILGMVANVLPWVGAALAVLILEAVFEAMFARKLLLSLKTIVGSTDTPPKFEAQAERVSAFFNNKWTIFGIRLAVFVLAVTFIGLGIANGGAQSVLIKAINICTECIGLG